MGLRRFLILFGLTGLGVIIVANLSSFNQFIGYLTRIHWYLIPLLIAVQILSYLANAKYYQSFFSISGHNLPLKRLFTASLGINFTNQAIPTGGIAGTAYLSEILSPSVPPGKSTLAQLGRYIFTLATNLPLLALGMLIIFFSGTIAHISVRLILLFTTIIIIIGVGTVSYLSDRSRMKSFITPLIRLFNRTGTFILRSHFKPLTPQKVGAFFDEFYSAYAEIMREKRNWLPLSLWTLGGNIAEIATVYVTFIGFGIWPNLGVVILGYQIAIAASLLGPLTAGAGLLELGMVGAFTALGLPFALSLAVVIVYRSLNMILFLPPGFLIYRQDMLK